MKRTAQLAVFLAAWLMTQGIISVRPPKEKSSCAAVLMAHGSLAARAPEDETHTHSELTVSELEPATVVRSVSGAEITTIAHFNCPSCGGELDILFPSSSRLSKREVRYRLRAEEQWCDAGRRCDWHGKLPSRSLRELRLSFGEWV